MPNAVINPDLSSVYRIPPHLWKLVDGKVVKMGLRDSINRIKHVNKHGANNDISTVPFVEPPPAPVIAPIEVVNEVSKSTIKGILVKSLPYLVSAAIGAAIAVIAIHIHVSYYL